jgi:DNA-binding Lrp family transcriptional regulator
MSVQPGVGYTFNSSSRGTNLTVETPWSEWDPSSAAAEQFVQQFQLRSVRVGTQNRLQMAKGTVSFTQSNMPRVRLGGHYDQRQTWISKVAVYGSGVSRTAGTGSPVWMEAGGYFNITTAGTYYVTVSKFDINQSNDDTESALLNAEAPWVSIFPAGDAIESAIFSETGPSEYVNKTNVQKMVGYDAMSTGLSGDWGNCHTTWFNPVKWGYSVKLIAIVTATAAPVGGGMVFAIDQHIVGPIDLQIPCVFNGTTLCNQDDLNETNDPYNLNKDATPPWSDIVNSNTLTALEEITPANEDWFQEYVGPADWTALNYSYLIPASCAAQDDGEVCLHPFYTYPRILKPDPADPATWLYRANVCGGMVNNLVPWNREGPTKQKLPTTIDFLPLLGTVNVYIRMGTEAYASDNPVFPVIDDSDEYYPTLVQYAANTPEEIEDLPVDTDEYCYILMVVARNVGDPENFTIDQMLSGSVWAERLKIGDNTARYYWAGV